MQLPLVDNKQEPEHLDRDSNGILDVQEVFYTIQGEGPFVGHPAVFLRLAGCNLQCPRCDTDYTSKRQRMSVMQIYNSIEAAFVQANIRPMGRGMRLVVITGGEPFRQNIADITRCLAMDDGNYKVQVETNGTLYAPRFPYDHRNVCTVCSPKTVNLNSNALPHFDAFKYVVEHGYINPDNGLPERVLGMEKAPWHWAPDKGGNRVRLGRVYIQPMDVGSRFSNNLNTQVAVQSCMKFGYRLGLQMHKFAGLP